jgi:predicted GNAT superfamily acetyltransferase
MQAPAVTIRALTVDELETLTSLQRQHYNEVALDKSMRLSPDWLRFRALEQQGSLLALAVQVGSDVVGYSVGILYRHLHYSDHLVYQNDVLFVDVEHRGGSVGLKLIRETEKRAREAGCSRVAWHAKEGTKLDALLPRLGYRVQDVIYTRSV